MADAFQRAAGLAARHPDTMFVVDDAQNARDLDGAAQAAGVRLNLVIELQVGRKGGIQPGQPALGLARLVGSLPNLKLAGLQAYAGHASHVAGFADRGRASVEALRPAVETRQLFEKDGIECPLLTAGSTGTYNVDAAVEGVTELQPGSFIFMDLDYNRVGGRDGPVFQDFRNALSVVTTIVSKPSRTLAIVDGGTKAFATDRPFAPEARGLPGVTYSWGGDEHGRLDLTKADTAVSLGDRVEFEVPHCDPTVNLYDRIYCLRGDAVESVWPVAARGMSQ